MVLLLIGLGGVPSVLFLLFCVAGGLMFIGRRRNRDQQATLAREIERMVPMDPLDNEGLPVTDD